MKPSKLSRLPFVAKVGAFVLPASAVLTMTAVDVFACSSPPPPNCAIAVNCSLMK